MIIVRFCFAKTQRHNSDSYRESDIFPTRFKHSENAVSTLTLLCTDYLISEPRLLTHSQLINKASHVGRWVKKHRSSHGIFDAEDEQIVKKLAAHVSTLLAKRNLQRQNQVWAWIKRLVH